MSEKNLTEAEWKKFSKGSDFKDAALLKALVALDKAKAPEQELEALIEMEKQADIVRKAHKADKELVSYLDVLDKSLDKQRKAADAELKKAKAKESEDEEEESPVLLTTKLLPLLRQVRKGEEMQAMLGSVGKEVAVLLSRRAISPSRRKLISDYIDAGTPKFYVGTCIFEENAYTFIFKTQAAGMAKKIKSALLKQVELRLKVRVRGEDPDDIDDDGEPAEEEEGASVAAAPAAPVAAALATPAAAPAAPAEDPLKDTFETRMAELQPRVIALIQAQAGDVSKLRAVAEFVREKGAAGQYKAALQGMDSLVKLVDAANQAQAVEAKADPAVATVAFTARLGALKLRIQEALAAADERAGQVKAKVGEAGAFAARKAFNDANRAVDELEALLAQGGKSAERIAGETEAPVSAAAAEYTALRDRLEKAYLSLMSGSIDPSMTDQFGAVTRAWGMADESMEAGNADRALLILKRLAEGGALEKLLKARETLAATTGKPGVKTGPSLVEQRKFMLSRWARIPAEIKAELDSLRRVIAEQELDEDPDELVDAIDDHLQDLLDELQNRLDTAVNTGDRSAFKGLRQQVENDSIVGHLLKAPFMDGSKFKQTTLAAIDEIEAALA